MLCGCVYFILVCFFFQAEDGIRDLVRSRGLGDVYKRQDPDCGRPHGPTEHGALHRSEAGGRGSGSGRDPGGCLLYTSDAADDLLCVDLGGRRIITKKKNTNTQ